VPFHFKRSQDVLGSGSITTTTETIHGLLRLDGDRLVIQWRLARKTDHLGGAELRTDRELEAVREVVLPVEVVAGAQVRRPPWLFFGSPKIVLTAADLRAFEEVAGEGGLRLKHPAELVVRVRRSDSLLAEELCAELALAVAEQALERHRERRVGSERKTRITGEGQTLPRPE
jgi:hypothetical protein